MRFSIFWGEIKSEIFESGWREKRGGEENLPPRGGFSRGCWRKKGEEISLKIHFLDGTIAITGITSLEF